MSLALLISSRSRSPALRQRLSLALSRSPFALSLFRSLALSLSRSLALLLSRSLALSLYRSLALSLSDALSRALSLALALSARALSVRLALLTVAFET